MDIFPARDQLPVDGRALGDITATPGYRQGPDIGIPAITVDKGNERLLRRRFSAQSVFYDISVIRRSGRPPARLRGLVSSPTAAMVRQKWWSRLYSE